jgi:Calcineurin-like phosphoesterase
MYDLIGDIHGHADELLLLLGALGYQRGRGVYRHAERKVIFLGDFIDRGPKISQVLDIVRPMIEEEQALAVMGNHELNALAYHTEDVEAPGEYLRRHTAKNERQHRMTIQQLAPATLEASLEWFRTLLLWLDLDGLRVVHACWDERAVATISQATHQQQGGLSAALLQSACTKGKELFAPVEIILKGKEAQLPDGQYFYDKDQHRRAEIRTRWYLAPQGHTYRSYALPSDEFVSDLALDESVLAGATPYPAAAKPVFFGHYWLSADRPEALADNVACLDYSVAKDGFLCGYRWQGEQKLTNDNFVWVKAACRYGPVC